MKKLKNGWVEGSVQELMDLSDADMAYIEAKMSLSRYMREQRCRMNLTQTRVAAMLKTSQSRVAKMEKGDPTVSLDLLFRALLALGIKPRKLAAVL